MGGTLTASSSVGEGSTFRFVAQFDLAPETSRKVRASPRDFNGNRVLLISDNATSSLILQKMLQDLGFESDAYRSPKDAPARLLSLTTKEQPYSLAVIDISMPATDAFALIAEIRRIARTLPIVMLDSNARAGRRRPPRGSWIVWPRSQTSGTLSITWPGLRCIGRGEAPTGPGWKRG
jgi:CheY-like chemotaxis protein